MSRRLLGILVLFVLYALWVRRDRIRFQLAASVLVLFAALFLLFPQLGDRRARGTLTATYASTGVAVPSQFMGLSVETVELPAYAANATAFANAIKLLTPDGARMNLRVGGQTADNTIWRNFHVKKRYSYFKNVAQIGKRWMRGLDKILRITHSSLILDTNLAAHKPRMAAAEIKYALAHLPRHSLQAVEVGDEPNLYQIGYVGSNWYKRNKRKQPHWMWHFNTSDYTRLLGAYAKAIKQVDPKVTLAGPSTGTNGELPWIQAAVKTGQLGMMTTHTYGPFTSCAKPGDPTYPSPAGYLNGASAVSPTTVQAPGVAMAQKDGLPVRDTEMGSVVCGGIAGISNTYTTGLWAPDALLNLMRQGVSGFNMHIHGYNVPASALIPNPQGGVEARPLFYGMAFLTRALNHATRLLDSTDPDPNVHTWALSTASGGVNMLYTNDAPIKVTVRVKGPQPGDGQLLRMTDPPQGTEIGGAQITSQGTWSKPLSQTKVSAASDGYYYVTLAPNSAALLQLP